MDKEEVKKCIAEVDYESLKPHDQLLKQRKEGLVWKTELQCTCICHKPSNIFRCACTLYTSFSVSVRRAAGRTISTRVRCRDARLQI